MDYKKKYEDLVKAVKALQETNPSDEGIQNWVNDNVPELKESEDEKIRKAIKYGLKYLEREMSWDFVDDVDILDIYEWLEKQDKLYIQQELDNAYLKGVSDAKHEIEKQDEQTKKMKKEIAEFIFNSKEDIKHRYEWIKCLGYDVKFSNKKESKSVEE